VRYWVLPTPNPDFIFLNPELPANPELPTFPLVGHGPTDSRSMWMGPGDNIKRKLGADFFFGQFCNENIREKTKTEKITTLWLFIVFSSNLKGNAIMNKYFIKINRDYFFGLFLELHLKFSKQPKHFVLLKILNKKTKSKKKKTFVLLKHLFNNAFSFKFEPKTTKTQRVMIFSFFVFFLMVLVQNRSKKKSAPSFLLM